MNRYIRLISIFFVILFLIIPLGSCKKPVYHYSGETQKNDVAVMGTVDVSQSDSGKKRVSITYDDGPHNIYTKKIVDELSKYGFNATFFIIGNRVDGIAYNGSSALVYAAENGNEIGIHGYTHLENYNKCSDEAYREDLKKTEDAIKNEIHNANVRLMRPAWGLISDERVKESKYSIILWNVDSEDWKYKYSSDDTEDIAKEKIQSIVDNVMNNVSDGSIILMHDIYESTYDATVIILERLYAEGYEVVTVSELLGADLSAGKIFSRKSE